MTTRNSLKKQIETIRQKIQFYSTHGDEEGIARLFVRAVQNHIIPDFKDLLPWCFKALGREYTEHVIKALAAWSCPVCKKGLEQCDLCDGSGWSGPDMLCEMCMGLGLIPCQFCGGSGLSTLESIPSGLRLTVVCTRARLTAKHVKTVKSKLNDPGREPDTTNSTRKPGETLLILNKLLSRLEGCLDEIKQTVPIHPRHRFLAAKVLSECAKAGVMGKKLIRQILQEMIKAEESSMRAPQANEAIRALSRLRIDFYQELLESGLGWQGSPLEHPLLDRAIQRIESHAKCRTAGKHKGDPFRSGGKPRVAA